jgi:putative ABC transport system permease protein
LVGNTQTLIAMLENYFKTGLRSLLRNKQYTIINIAGLSVGIAACLVLFLIIRYETGFDDFHANPGRIYRVVSSFDVGGKTDYSRGSAFPVARQLRLDYPQLEKVARINGSPGDQISVLDASKSQVEKKFNEVGLFFAEPEFFEIFNFPFLAGNPGTALAEPYTIVLTQQTAEKYFGNWKDAVGRYVKYRNRKVCKVTGILQNIPDNTDFPISAVMSFKTTSQDSSSDFASTQGDLNTFVVLPPGLTEAAFDKDLQAFAKRHKPAAFAKDSYALQPLKDIHFNDRFGTYRKSTFSRQLITALALVGAFLLLIACVNFINLATAQAVTRAREVGVRKVLGSGRGRLIGQFLSETFILTLLSICMALGLSGAVLPFVNDWMSIHIKFELTAALAGFLFLLAVVVTFLSGFYPALVLSGFNPITALKSKLSGNKGGAGISLRRALVVFQFTIAQVLIIGTLVIAGQMDFFKTADMGFDKEAIVNVHVPDDSVSRVRLTSLKTRLLEQPGIQGISFSTFTIADGSGWSSEFTFDNSSAATSFPASLKWADADAFKLYKLSFVAGRPYYPSDTVNEFVVNETLVKKLGLRHPEDILGRNIDFWGQVKARVVGVVKDFHGKSLEKEMDPIVMAPWKEVYQYMSVKISPGRIGPTMATIEKEWNAFLPNAVYDYQFMDDKIAGFYKQEAQVSRLYRIFAVIAIFISCLGLYGLVSFMALQRTREVGIRKVLGASAGHIVFLFSREFTILVGISFLVAGPISYYVMRRWLDNFSYRISLSAGFFVLALICSLGIAWITVGYKAMKAARANPVNSLRAE